MKTTLKNKVRIKLTRTENKMLNDILRLLVDTTYSVTPEYRQSLKMFAEKVINSQPIGL